MKKVVVNRQNEKIQVGGIDFNEIDIIDATYAHKQNVLDIFRELFYKGEEQVQNHDYTKTKNIDEYTRALKTSFANDVITGENWRDMHYKKERHHLNNHVPDDVNLLDVMEMICDVVAAARARHGYVLEPVTIPADVLQRAFKNTVNLVLDNTETAEYIQEIY